MHRWWAFTPPVWCGFGEFSRYKFYSAGVLKILYHFFLTCTSTAIVNLH